MLIYDKRGFQQALGSTLALAREKLGDDPRLDEARNLLLSGAILPDGPGHKIPTSADSTTFYHVLKKHCDCPNWQPGKACVHVLAAWLSSHIENMLCQDTPETAPSTPPASASCTVMLAGRPITITLYGYDDMQLCKRLEKLLQAYPAVCTLPPTPHASPEYCQIHSLKMHKKTNSHGTWFSHRLEDGSYCKGT